MKKIIKGVADNITLKKKYNTLLLKYDILQEELEKKTVQLNTERRINLKRKQIWEEQLKEQEKQIIELKRRKKNVGTNKNKQ